MTLRQNTRKIRIGNRVIGGGNSVAVQSMLSVPSTDIAGSVAQAKALEAAGCEILRAAIPDMDAIPLIETIKKETVAIPAIMIKIISIQKQSLNRYVYILAQIVLFVNSIRGQV